MTFLDHVLGRPSPTIQRIHVIGALLLASYVLKRPTAPWPLESINKRLLNSKIAPWKIILGTTTGIYFIRNLFLLVFLNAPEPMSRMYTRNFYRASWILTALDAGFLTAMNIRPKPLRDLMSCLFSLFYLVYADHAEEKVRKFKAVATVETMRVSWAKSTNPILRFLTYFDRGWLDTRENLSIPRPLSPSPTSFPDVTLGDIKARLYFKGSKERLADATDLIFHVPGGGFVCMEPENHDDYVSAWARKTGVPILSINYGKSPEHPYPWALEEAYDAYRSVVESNGKVIGMRGWTASDGKTRNQPLNIIFTGDSAGANLACGVILRTLEPTSVFPAVSTPKGVMMLYPCLSFEMGCWMPQSQMKLMRAESANSMLHLPSLLQAKENYTFDEEVSPLAVPEAPKKIDVLHNIADYGDTGISGWMKRRRARKRDSRKNQLNGGNSNADDSPRIRSRLSMTSRMSYFQDRLLSPELMRAMALLYLNGSPVPYNVSEDIYLSPLNAPREMLERFPPVYFLTGEKDPMADDTVVFAARIRQAKAYKKGRSKGGFGVQKMKPMVDSTNDQGFGVHVKILEGMSHAFMNCLTFLPEAWQSIELTSTWFMDLLNGEMVPEGADYYTRYTSRAEEASGSDSEESVDLHTPELMVVRERNLMERRRDTLAKQHL